MGELVLYVLDKWCAFLEVAFPAIAPVDYLKGTVVAAMLLLFAMVFGYYACEFAWSKRTVRVWCLFTVSFTLNVLAFLVAFVSAVLETSFLSGKKIGSIIRKRTLHFMGIFRKRLAKHLRKYL